MVVSELRGEKIDIIPFNEEPARFVAKALSPARVREVLVDDEDKQATVIVPDDQLSLAIGRDGQNARLAAKLTGWRVDIKSETEFSEVEDEMDFEQAEDAEGRCAAVLSNGRRCPNASLPGSRYCGLPQHQALARFSTNHVTVLAPVSEEEIERLANPDTPDDDVAPIVERAEAEFSEQQAEQEAAEAEEELEEAEDEALEEIEEEQAEEDAAEADEVPDQAVADNPDAPAGAVEDPGVESEVEAVVDEEGADTVEELDTEGDAAAEAESDGSGAEEAAEPEGQPQESGAE
jgi:N utilization substance protein A